MDSSQQSYKVGAIVTHFISEETEEYGSYVILQGDRVTILTGHFAPEPVLFNTNCCEMTGEGETHFLEGLGNVALHLDLER